MRFRRSPTTNKRAPSLTISTCRQTIIKLLACVRARRLCRSIYVMCGRARADILNVRIVACVRACTSTSSASELCSANFSPGKWTDMPRQRLSCWVICWRVRGPPLFRCGRRANGKDAGHLWHLRAVRMHFGFESVLLQTKKGRYKVDEV